MEGRRKKERSKKGKGALLPIESWVLGGGWSFLLGYYSFLWLLLGCVQVHTSTSHRRPPTHCFSCSSEPRGKAAGLVFCCCCSSASFLFFACVCVVLFGWVCRGGWAGAAASTQSPTPTSSTPKRGRGHTRSPSFFFLFPMQWVSLRLFLPRTKHTS